MRARRLVISVATVLFTVLATSCGGGSGDDSGQGPARLSFWSWVPNIDKVVDVWNRAHPEIQVTYAKQANGDEAAAKLLTAAKGGNPPDVAQVEYQVLPTMVAGDVLADIKKHADPVKIQFSEGIWRLVTLGSEAVYAVPQDSGPMMFYYRADLFEEMGLAVPKTWDEFAETARQVREKDSARYLANFSAADPGWFAGLTQQAGAQWWSTSGDAWKVSMDDAATQKVASFWGGLVKDGVIDDKPSYTPEWNKKLNDGNLLAWPSAVWAPGVLSGAAPKGKGKWAMAPMPQWSPGEQRTGFWGGSSMAVTAKSKHQEQAARFVTWLNTDPQALDLLVKEGSIYPAATKGQAALQQAPEYFSGQPDFYRQAATIAGTAQGFTFGPNVNTAYNAYKDAFGQAIKNKSDFAAALRAMQSTTVTDLQKQGFKVG